MLKGIAQSIIQDLITSLAAVLTAHGVLSSTPIGGMPSTEQEFIGAAFFLVMLAFNYILDRIQKVNAASAGANAIGGTLTPTQATNIAKGKTP